MRDADNRLGDAWMRALNEDFGAFVMNKMLLWRCNGVWWTLILLVGVAVTVVPVEADKPVVGNHLTESGVPEDKAAVKVAEPPVQILVELALILAVMVLLTVTTAEAVLVQPLAKVPVTV